MMGQVNEDKINGKEKTLLKINEVSKKPDGKELDQMMKQLQQDIIDKVGDSLDDLVFQVVKRNHLKESEIERNVLIDKRQAKGHQLLEKCFLSRDSLLTTLFNEVKHIQTIYNVFIAIFITVMLNIAAYDFFESGSFKFGFTTLTLGFSKFSQVIEIWCLMAISTFSFYAAYHFWAQKRLQWNGKNVLRVWNWLGLFASIFYQIMFMFFSSKAVFDAYFPPPGGFIILLEQVRMVMKVYAFVRSTVPKVINYKPHTEGKEFEFPKFSKFLYFFFAPTIVYRDNYPRTKEIRWKIVIWHFFEIVLIIFLLAFMFERFVIPVHKDFGLKPFNSRELILKTVAMSVPAILIYLSGFYCLLHAWMNAWAELLRFGDRLFYKDWWNSTAYTAFYRNWNIVVHDWLYIYVYKDLCEIVFPENKNLAMFIVFFVSAIVHEYIIAVSLGFFFPAMFFLFGIFGLMLLRIMMKNSNIVGNIFIWFGLINGSGMLISSYTMEYFSRQNCPSSQDKIIDFFLPRSWLCYKNYSNVNYNGL